MRSRSPVILILLAAAMAAQQPPGPAPPPVQQAPVQPRSHAPQSPEQARGAQRPPAQPESASARELAEETAVTHHKLRTGGQLIDYTATAGTIVLRKEDGAPRASIFYVAYTKDGVEDPSKRPLAFAFNGGPGSSSVWLQMGALGPRRVVMQESGHALPPPYQIVDNEYSILDETDLVFIDPVSTGYSRAANEREAREFHGYREDIASVGDFIRLYTTRAQRWLSPKYIAGESYGTTRAAGLAAYLQDEAGMYLNGIALISAVLDFQTIMFTGGNDLPYILFLPTYTATAWYHKKLPPDLQADFAKALAESKRFASNEYALALLKGDALAAGERAAVAKELARLTGLTPEYVLKSNLRIESGHFRAQLLPGLTVGRYDSRITGADMEAVSATPEYDPSYAVVQGAFTAAFNAYVRRELNFTTDLPYEILTGRVRPWNWEPYENRFVYVAGDLRQAMIRNPFLRVFVAKGYYDLATPIYAIEYTVDHMPLVPALRNNITGAYYGAGHMMYTDRASLAKLKSDLAAFIQ